jgi:hypothetical protein
LEDVFVRKLPAIAFAGVAAAALAGTAFAAARSHVMKVSLPDGSVARIEYAGDVAPKVVVEPIAPVADQWAATPLPSFAGFGQMIEQMDRQTEAMIRDAQQMARQPGTAPGAPFVASFGDAPAGVTSTTIVSYSTGGSTCTRTTESVAQGPGRPPKVTSSVSGNCGTSGSPAPRASAAPINRT